MLILEWETSSGHYATTTLGDEVRSIRAPQLGERPSAVAAFP